MGSAWSWQKAMRQGCPSLTAKPLVGGGSGLPVTLCRDRKSPLRQLWGACARAHTQIHGIGKYNPCICLQTQIRVHLYTNPHINTNKAAFFPDV